MSEQSLTLLLAIFLVVIGWGFAIWFRQSGQHSTEARVRDDRLNKLDVQIALLNYRARRRWDRDENLIDELHHPHPEYAEMDELLEKVENGVTVEETERLQTLLTERSSGADPQIGRGEKESARKLWAVLDRVGAGQ